MKKWLFVCPRGLMLYYKYLFDKFGYCDYNNSSYSYGRRNVMGVSAISEKGAADQCKSGNCFGKKDVPGQCSAQTLYYSGKAVL